MSPPDLAQTLALIERRAERDLRGALAAAEALLAQSPRSARVLAVAGALGVLADEPHGPAFKKALERLRTALSLGEPSAAWPLAQALAGEGPRQAESVLAEVTRAAEQFNSAAMWATVGWLTGFALRRHREAMESYERALALDETAANTRLQFGVVLCTSGDLERASCELARGLRGHPTWREHEGWLRLGEAHLGRGRLRRALGAFRRAQQTDRRGEYSFQLQSAVNALSTVLVQRGQFFLHLHDEDRLRTRAEANAAPTDVDWVALARDAREAQPALPAAARSALDVVRACAEARALSPELADRSAALELELHGGEAHGLLWANRWLDAEFVLYRALLDREEPWNMK